MQPNADNYRIKLHHKYQKQHKMDKMAKKLNALWLISVWPLNEAVDMPKKKKTTINTINIYVYGFETQNKNSRLFLHIIFMSFSDSLICYNKIGLIWSQRRNRNMGIWKYVKLYVDCLLGRKHWQNEETKSLNYVWMSRMHVRWN